VLLITNSTSAMSCSFTGVSNVTHINSELVIDKGLKEKESVPFDLFILIKSSKPGS